jgi:hypothetical protein
MGEDQKNGLSPAIRRYRDGEITAAQYLKEIRKATGQQVKRDIAATRKRAKASEAA